MRRHDLRDNQLSLATATVLVTMLKECLSGTPSDVPAGIVATSESPVCAFYPIPALYFHINLPLSPWN